MRCLPTTVLAGAVAAIELLGALTAGQFAAALTRAGHAFDAPLTAHDLIALLFFPVLLATYVVLSLWFYRANAFLSQQGTPQRFKKIWAWFMWVIPFASLVIPYMFMRSIASAKQKTLVAGWWAGFLIWNFSSAATSNVVSFSGEIFEPVLGSYTVIYWIQALALTASWVCLAKIIRDFTETHASPQPQSAPVAP